MNSQDFRNLQEAYLDVYYELDEAGTPLPVGKMDAKAKELKSKFLKSKPGSPEAKKLISRASQIIGTRDSKVVSDSYDLYDIILSHLIDEGYADTNENALVIMTNMSEEWRESILLDEMQGIRNPRVKLTRGELLAAKEIMRKNAQQAGTDALIGKLKRASAPPEPRKPDRVGNPDAAPPSGEGLNSQRKPPRPRVVTPYEPPTDPSTGKPVDLEGRRREIAPFGTVKPPFIPPAAPKKIR